MNYEQANAVKHLAPDVMKVLEGLEGECPECKGIQDPIYHCVECHKGKIHYSWTPQVGEYIKITFPSGIESIQSIASLYDGDIWVVAPCEYPPPSLVVIEREHITPILDWQVIEEILEKAGYELYLTKMDGCFKCRIYKGDDELVLEQRKDRLSTVYYAVLALGKELK